MDNWDFTNPVNQRGQSSYSNAGYTIDRWKIAEQSKITVNSDSISVKGRMYQMLEEFAALGGETVTLSLLYTNNTNSTEGRINVLNGSTWLSENVNIKANVFKNIISTTFTVPNILSEFAVNFISENATIKLHAYKLELGEVSTLKNDALGMSYDKELYKCQKYLQIIRNESNNEYVTIFDSVPWQVTRDFIAYRLIRPMRKTPVLTYVNIRAQTANGYFYPINIYIEQDDTIISEDVPLVKLRIESADNTNYPLPNEAYLMNIGAKGYIMFSADL